MNEIGASTIAAAAVPEQVAPPVRLSVIVPTFNERDNVGQLITRVAASLRGIAWEMIVVDDDSPDQTWAAVQALARQDARIRCLRRIGRRGLSGACIEGILASSAPYAAVIDADLQHDERQLIKMFALLQDDAADLVVGSRYISGGSAGSFTSGRLGISVAATKLARRALGVTMTDPMSGFFMVRTDRFAALAPSLSVHGFKILLDLVASARGRLRIIEIPYSFGARLHGESKLSSIVVLDFLGLILAKSTRDVVSLRFLLFALVGASGFIVHFVVLYAALYEWGLAFAPAQTAAALTAMTTNFFLNNALTYRDQRLKAFALLKGLLVFYAICSVGLIANVGIAFSIYGQRPVWWLAGAAGAVMGAVWNYAASSLFVWRVR